MRAGATEAAAKRHCSGRHAFGSHKGVVLALRQRRCEHRALTALLTLLRADKKNMSRVAGMFESERVFPWLYSCVLAQWWQQQRSLQESQSYWWQRSWASLVRASLPGSSLVFRGGLSAAHTVCCIRRHCMQWLGRSSVHRRTHWYPSLVVMSRCYGCDEVCNRANP